ncbi:LOW QUALITY PROTEIN: hypothetical protein QYF61_018325, partial [Mycteria americana]
MGKKNWLAGQAQGIVINGLYSAQGLVPSGVPVLGPVLFNMVIDDLEEVMECTPARLADGIRGTQPTFPRAGLPSEGHKQAGGWDLQEHCEFSKGKCKALHLGRKRPQPRYRLGTCQMENSSVAKDLGVLVKDRAKLFTAVCAGMMRDNE